MSDPDQAPLFDLVRSDPDGAWPLVLAYAKEHAGDGFASALIEEFIYEHDDRFIDRLEAVARADPVLRELIAMAYVGGTASRGAKRFRELQARLGKELGWPE